MKLIIYLILLFIFIGKVVFHLLHLFTEFFVSSFNLFFHLIYSYFPYYLVLFSSVLSQFFSSYLLLVPFLLLLRVLFLRLFQKLPSFNKCLLSVFWIKHYLQFLFFHFCYYFFKFIII